MKNLFMSLCILFGAITGFGISLLVDVTGMGFSLILLGIVMLSVVFAYLWGKEEGKKE